MNKMGLIALAAVLASAPLSAKEGGDQYPNGAENWFAGAMPPPGNYFLNYFGNWSGTLRDGDGHTVRPAGKKVRMNATFDALRFVQMTPQQLWGAQYGWSVILPLVSLSIDTPAGKDRRTSIGDVTLTPLILAWHRPQWHYVLGLDVNLPTGAFDRNAHPGRNLGANYASVEPIFALTYLNPQGWEASAKFMYNIKTRNRETHYQSGDEFHMDYLLGKHFGPWSVGVSGYYLKQVTDDRQHGRKVGDGNRGQVFAFGPSVKYETAGKTQLIFQWQHETQVENRFGGDKVWFKLITPL